jgi:hypothetical protein
MKEATKDNKAVAEFRAMDNYNEVIVTIVGNNYKCYNNVVYQIIDDCNSLEIATI